MLKFVSDLRLAGGFLRVLRFPLTMKLTARYIGNIVESGIKQHNPNPLPYNSEKYKDIFATAEFIYWYNKNGFYFLI